MTTIAAEEPPQPFPDVTEWAKRSQTPSSHECRAMWARWAMPEHIQTHSQLVTCVALDIAEMVKEKLVPDLDIAQVRSAAMLHDLAKLYTIRHGGSHSQIGAAWVQELTGNVVVARAILHHVHWPFAMDLGSYPVSLIICYSDKRVRHTDVVSLDERFLDLQERYGVNARASYHIQQSLEQGRAIERLLCEGLRVELDAHSFDCRRLV